MQDTDVHRPSVQRWLRLERAAGEGGPGQVYAELALARLFELMPELAPGPLFEEGVLARVRTAPPVFARWRQRLGPWGVRAAVVWGVLQAGVVVALWFGLVRGLSLSLGPVRLLAAVGALVAEGLDWIADSLPVAVGVAEAVQSSLSSAGLVVPALLFACVAASAAGFLLVASHLSRAGETVGALR